jgi:hypothetical protein
MNIEEFVKNVTSYKVISKLDIKESIKSYCKNTLNCNGIDGTIFTNDSVEYVMSEIIRISNIDVELISIIKEELSIMFDCTLTSYEDYFLFGNEITKIHNFFLEYIYYQKKEEFNSASQVITQMENIISVYNQSIKSGVYYNNITKVLFGNNEGKKVNHSYGSREYIFLLNLMVKVLPNVNTRWDNKSTYIIKKDKDNYQYTGAYKQFCLLLKLIFDNSKNEINSKSYVAFIRETVWLFSRIENRSVETNTKPIEIRSKKDDNIAYLKQCETIRTTSINAVGLNPKFNKDLIQDERFILTKEELIDILKGNNIIK